MGNPCLRCGACCAYYRASFYWTEADPFLGGTVPPELTVQLTPHHCAMRGTTHPPLRCVALDGAIGDEVKCSIYERRSSSCHDVEPWEEDGSPGIRCSRARAAHNLPPLEPRTDKPLGPGHTPLPISA